FKHPDLILIQLLMPVSGMSAGIFNVKNMYSLTDEDKGIFDVADTIQIENHLDFGLIEVKNSKVNSRGLWQFLEIKKDFSNWIKYQIERLDLVENIDYHIEGEPLKNNIKEYFLSLDIAKEVAMISLTENGKKARKYFIEVEKKLTEPRKELSTLDILELATGEIKKLKADLDYKNKIVIERAESVPAETMRLTINRVVRNYAKQESIWHQVVWSKLYEEFKYRFHLDLKARAKKGKSKIQVAEDLGRLEDLYNLALKMFEENRIIVGIKI
ncbi:MAG: antA/AntB antirepressor family protein, partial [Fusobacteriaceae bacterium]